MIKEYFGCKVFVDEVINKQHIDNILSGVDLKSYTRNNQEARGSSRNWDCHVNTGLEENDLDISGEEWFREFIGKVYHEISYYIRNTIFTEVPLRHHITPWVNYYERGNWQERHHHTTPEIAFSFNYIHKCPPDSGVFRFHNPLPNIQTGFFKFYEDRVDVPAKEGTLIIFPPWMEHSVGFNNSDDPRITISGNFYFEVNHEALNERKK